MGVNKVELANGETLVDLTGNTVTPDVLLEGYTATNAQGEQIEGRMPTEGGSSVEEIFWVTCDIDQSTLSVSNFSHTYDEIIQAANEGKMVKGKGFISGLPIEFLNFDLSYVGGYSGHIIFAAFFRTIIQGQTVCLYINLRMDAYNSIQNDIMIVNTTDM